MSKIDLPTFITGLGLSLFGLFFDFVLKPNFYATIGTNVLPPGASTLFDLFGPMFYVIGGIFALSSIVSLEVENKDKWNAKEEVKKYLEKKVE